MADKWDLFQANTTAQEVLVLLGSVEDTLRAARGWSFRDFFARGSLVSSWVKFSQIRQVQEQLRQIQLGLLRLERLLAGLNLRLELNMSELRRHVELACQQGLADWIVQTQILERLQEIQYVKSEVERLVSALAHAESA